MSTNNNSTINPQPSTPAQEDAAVETDPAKILLAAEDNGVRGAKLLEVAITSGADAGLITEVVAYQFPDKETGWKDDPFAWIGILKAHGVPHEAIVSMLVGVLFYRDTRYETDMATEKCAAFLKAGGPWNVTSGSYWKFISRDDFVRVVERCAVKDPHAVLNNFQKISWTLAKYDGAPDWSNDGQRRTVDETEEAQRVHWNATADMGMSQTLPFIRRACAEVQFISTVNEANAVIQMPLDVRKRVLQQVFTSISNAGAVVPPIRNLATVYLALQVLISGGADHDLENKIVGSILWKPTEWRNHTHRETVYTGQRSSGLRGGNAWQSAYSPPAEVAVKDNDPERAVRLFRWYLKYLAEVPVNKEDWMGRWITPETARQNATASLVTKCRKALETVGFRFVRVEMGKEPHTGDPRHEVRLEAPGTVKLYIHDYRGRRGDRFPKDGEEVIVPNSLPDQPLFRRRIEDGQRALVGWYYEFHPIDAPSAEMIWQSGKNDGNI